MADLTRQLRDALSQGSSNLSEAERLELIQASFDLATSFESPVEKILRICVSGVDAIATRIAVDLRLFDLAVAHDGPISLAKLARLSGSEEDLLLRILRILTQNGYFTQPTSTTFLPTPTAQTLTAASPFSSAVVHITNLNQSFGVMPKYFETRGYNSPTDATDAPFNHAVHFRGTAFDYLALPGNERFSAACNATMTMQPKSTEAEWTSSGYPAVEKLGGDDVDPDRVVFVDVGGGWGHQVEKFNKQYPQVKGKLVVEDLSHVVEGATVASHITKVGHSFFEPQPEAVKGAKAYYMRSVLHDWPQKQAQVILEQIMAVMSDDSLILVHESILPEIGTTYIDARLDWHLMGVGALERTEKQWHALAASVGLKINGIWWEKAGLGKQALMEMVKI